MEDSCVDERVQRASEAQEHTEPFNEVLLSCCQTTVLLFVRVAAMLISASQLTCASVFPDVSQQ